MTEIQNTKKYDLEERTFKFAKNTSELTRKLPKTLENIEYRKQLVRSSGSVAANYIEANSASSKKDFINFFTHSLKSANE
jgi:four helix bundle protein